MDAAAEISEDAVSTLWRRLDMPGHEAVRIYDGEDGWYLDGSAVFLFEGAPVRLEYLIECDSDWQTRFVTVDGFVGDEVVAIEIENEDDVWYLNGDEIREVKGCTDIDLNFSPVTNVLPIKRLNLAVGDAESVRAAWLRFPSFYLEPLEQVYSRKTETVFNYRSTTGFEKDITVDDFGLVVAYSDFWVRETE
jgi:uncharacterized protein